MRIIPLLFTILLFNIIIIGQEKTNDDINREIRSRGVEHITVTYDQPGNASKLMAVSENFSSREADSAGVLAINFAMGFFYAGKSLKAAPESLHFAFWVLTKKPRFAENHHLIIELDGRTIDLGEARYAAKPNQNLEYLNFELSGANLNAMASSRKITFRIGERNFSATTSQMNLIRATANITKTSDTN